MGSSKYEYDPEGLDRDIKERNDFLENVAAKELNKKLLEFCLTDEMVMSIRKQFNGTCRMTIPAIHEHLERRLINILIEADKQL